MRRQKIILAFLAFISAPAFTPAAENFSSTEKRVSLLELYTSEGCSSCPPADRWLSEFTRDPRLWREIVPVAFHVDYWNSIGWRDRFSDPAYSERQRQYARQNHVTTVYTPGFLLNGREWRSFFGLRRLKTQPAEAAGRLTVEVDGNQVQASFRPASVPAGNLALNVAVLGFELVTEVRAGENRGRSLTYDFTVLGFESGLFSRGEGGYTASVPFPVLTVESSRRAIAAWVSQSDDPTPLQATGGWLKIPAIKVGCDGQVTS